MKKILLLSAMVGGMVTGAQAQQLPNNDFDQVWEDCHPYVAGKKVPRVQGQQPGGWTISNVNGMEGSGATTVGTEDLSHTGKAVQLTNTANPIMKSQIVPAYLTLGTTWSTSHVKISWGIKPEKNDGGTFGGLAFTNKPDAITFDYKTNSSQAQQPMIVAYLWSGSWSQASVPTEIKVGAPATETMVDRDRNILGMATSQGGAVTSNNGVTIATIQQNIAAKTNDWETTTVEFTYNKPEATPEKLNVIFSAGNYFADATNVIKGLTVSIDNVKLVYYHELLSVKYNGTSYNVGNNNEIDLSTVAYDPTLPLEFTKKGVGATIKTSFNEATQVMTVDVLGNDFDEVANPESKTTYTLKFAQKPIQLGSLSVNGEALSTELTEGFAYITIRGEYDESKVIATATNPSVAVTKSYDADSRICTIQTTADGAPKGTYFIKFAKSAQAVPSQLVIGMGNFLDAPAQSVEITDVQNGKVDLQLLNFSLEMFGGLIGDIFVTDIPYAEQADGTVKLYKQIPNFYIFGLAGTGICAPTGLPLELNGQINKDKTITATINITWMGNHIIVKVYPVGTTSIDATGLTSVDNAKIRQGLTNPNALIYADAGATNAAANDVVAGTCTELKLTDGHPFNAPVAFKATAVNYNRTFNTTANYVSSFVLPFAMDKAKVDGKVYQFAGVEGDYVNFTEVTEGMLAANTPYLIEATAANPFNHATYVQVAVTPATMQVANGDYAHVGTYTTQAVKSEGNTSYYGYANGAFVKANTGTLNPFRTMIKATVANAQAQFSLKLGNEVTGIIGVNSELGKVDVYNLEGKLIRNQVEATTALQGLAKGVYVINGKKVIK